MVATNSMEQTPEGRAGQVAQKGCVRSAKLVASRDQMETLKGQWGYSVTSP